MDSLAPGLMDKVLQNLDADDIKSALGVNKNWKEMTKQHIRKRPDLSHTPDISELHALHQMPLPVFFLALCWYLAFQSQYGIDMIKHYVRVFRDVGLNRCIACLVPLMVACRFVALYVPLLFCDHAPVPLVLILLSIVITLLLCTPLPSQIRDSPLFIGAVACMTLISLTAETKLVYLTVENVTAIQAVSIFLCAMIGLSWILVLPSAIVFAAAEHFQVHYDSIPSLTTPMMSGFFSLQLLFAVTALLHTAQLAVLIGLLSVCVVIAGPSEISRGLAAEFSVCAGAALLVTLHSLGFTSGVLLRGALLGGATFSCASAARTLAFGALLPPKSSLGLSALAAGVMWIANKVVV